MHPFFEWLFDQLRLTGINQTELSVEAGLSASTISTAISRDRPPSAENVIAIAKVLKVSPIDALSKAGYLPGHVSFANVAQEILGYKLAELSPSQLDELLKFIEWMQMRDGRDPDRPTAYRKSRNAANDDRQGSPTPAETLNNNT